MSTALYDAIPATDPLVIPAIANAGQPSPWNLGAGAVIGSVLSVRDVQQSGGESLYVLLPNGVQRISPFVASLLRSANSFGDVAPVAVSPDRLAPVPVVESLPVAYYPADPAAPGRHLRRRHDLSGVVERLHRQVRQGDGAVRSGTADPAGVRRSVGASGQRHR